MSAQEIIDGSAPLRKKLLALPLLPENKRLITAWRLGDELGKSRDRIDDVIGLLHAEEDPAVLHWLGEIIRGGRGALAKITDAEWVDLVATLLHGQPAEKRRAVAGVHSEYMRSPPPEVRDALEQCIRSEQDPGVVAMAAQALLVLQMSWEGMADDLAGATQRIPEGKLRREMTYVYKRSVDVGLLYERFSEARSDGERNDWAYAISIAWSEGRLDEAEDPRRLFVDVYAGVRDPDVRLRLLGSCPSDAAIVRELVAMETVPRVREKLAELLKR